MADNADASGSGIESFGNDFRSASESSATDGSQHTDINSALFAPLPETANFIFSGWGSSVNSATLTIDIGGVQVQDFGQTLTSLNGVAFDLLNIQQGVTITEVLTFNLDAAVINSINTLGFLDLELDRNANNDAIFIDFASLTVDVKTVSAPSAIALTGLSLLLLSVRRRFS